MQKKKIAVIIGTRPEAIKLAPVYFALRDAEGMEPLMVNTGQHQHLLDQVSKIFGLKYDCCLNLMQDNQSLAGFASRAIVALDEMIGNERPDAILVQGDTSTALAGALAGYYHQIPVGHVEAGLRSHDKYSPFPEEINRRLIAPIAEWSFAPTFRAFRHLSRENIPKEKIFIVGNTVVDALHYVAKKIEQESCQLYNSKERMILVTLHRREHFGPKIIEVLKALRRIVDAVPDTRVVLPVHYNPNVRERVYEILGGHPRIELHEPFEYETFVYYLKNCYLVMTDSGGVQEEAPVFGKPVLVLRENTERMESIEEKVAVLVGTNGDHIVNVATNLLQDASLYRAMAKEKSIYGDGASAERIVQVVRDALLTSRQFMELAFVKRKD